MGDSPKYQIKLDAYDLKGKWLWHDEQVGIIYGIQIMAGVLTIKTSSKGAGASLSSSTTLISAKLAEPVWVAGDWIISRPADHLALFSADGPAPNDDEPTLQFRSVTLLAFVQEHRLQFTPLPRPDCGKPWGIAEAVGQHKFTSRYIYIQRQDDCGAFMTRFDWVKPGLPPLVLKK